MDADIVKLRAEVTRNPWRAVGAKYVEFVDHAGNLVGLLVAVGVAARLAWVEWWIGGFALIGLAVVLTLWAAMAVLMDRTAALRALLDAPKVSISLATFRGRLDSGYPVVLVRVLVTNDSDIARNVTAKVVEASYEGPEAPWPAPWRHGDHRRVHRLFPGDSEMLLLASENQWDLGVHVLAEQGRESEHATIENNGVPYRLQVNLWDADTGQLAADFAVESPCDLSGEVSLIRYDVP